LQDELFQNLRRHLSVGNGRRPGGQGLDDLDHLFTQVRTSGERRDDGHGRAKSVSLLDLRTSVGPLVDRVVGQEVDQRSGKPFPVDRGQVEAARSPEKEIVDYLFHLK
jgi:hypothetical protein